VTPEDRVVELLRTLAEAQVSYGFGSTGNGLRLMPSMWHDGSYAELELRLRQLRESRRRQLWWHTSYRYRFGEELTIVAPVVRLKTGPEFRLPPFTELIAGGPAVGSKAAWCRVYRWRPDINLGLVAQGVSTLTGLMYDGNTERIVLPDDVYRRTLGLQPREVSGNIAA
jgi:hypothetical protein